MTEWRWWQLWAVLTAALYARLAATWFLHLVPEAEGLTPFDGRALGYSLEDAQEFLSALSDLGNALYRQDIRVLDSIFPFMLAVLLAWPLWRLGRGPWRGLAVLPAIYLCADYSENAAVAVLLAERASPDPGTVALASALTQTKFAFLFSSLIALLLVYVRTRRT